MTKAIVEAKRLVKMHAATPSQREAARILNRARSEEQWVALCTSNKEDIRLRALQYMEDRKAGKPFISENPNGPRRKAPETDPRLQAAIKNLLPNAQPDEPPAPKVPEPDKVM